MIITSNWENTTDIYQGGLYYPYSVCTPDGVAISNDYSYSGTSSLKFTLRATDPTCGGSRRSELYVPASKPILANLDKYQIALYYPSSFVSDKNPECHIQLHQVASSGSPLFELWVESDKIYLVQAYDAIGAGKQTIKKTFLANVVRNQWVVWTFHYEKSLTSTGRIRVWRNKKLMVDIKGANFNMVNGQPEATPYPKFGIYKWPWGKAGTFNPNTRVIYVDALKMADNATSIDELLATIK